MVEVIEVLKNSEETADLKEVFKNLVELFMSGKRGSENQLYLRDGCAYRKLTVLFGNER